MSYQEEYEKKLKAYYSCFRDSEAGKIVLQDLEGQFYKKKIIGEEKPIDSTALLLNVGSREVVVYILSLIEEFELMQRS